MHLNNQVASQSLVFLLASLWKHINRECRLQLAILFLLMIVASFAELLSLGATIPFLGVLTVPHLVFDYPVLQPLIRSFVADNGCFYSSVHTLICDSCGIIVDAVSTRFLYCS